MVFYQSKCWADSTLRTRKSQWKKYFQFCETVGLPPLPATLDMVLMYIAYMAESLAYSSITNYLSALWVLHKYLGYVHVDKSSFQIRMTLQGVKRVLGDQIKQATPITLAHLQAIYQTINLSSSEDITFWLSILLGYRALLRKANLFEPGSALQEQNVQITPWGTLLTLTHTKTIQFRQRILQIPLVSLPSTSYLCVSHFTQLHRSLRGRVPPSAHFLAYNSGDVIKPATYTWFSARLNLCCLQCHVPALSSHSLRRGGATAMAEAGMPLHDIRSRGDWRSLSVLLYLERGLDSKINLDTRLCRNMSLLN